MAYLLIKFIYVYIYIYIYIYIWGWVFYQKHQKHIWGCFIYIYTYMGVGCYVGGAWVNSLSYADYQNNQLFQITNPARGRVGRVTDCGVRGLWFKSPGSILTSRTETSSLSRVVRDGWDPCSVPVSGYKI